MLVLLAEMIIMWAKMSHLNYTELAPDWLILLDFLGATKKSPILPTPNRRPAHLTFFCFF